MNTEEKLLFLYNNRLLRDEDDIEKFDEILSDTATLDKVEYIRELCKVFDDRTEHSEVMYGLVHTVEYFYKIFGEQAALEQVIRASIEMRENAFEWLQTLLIRIFNHKECKETFSEVLASLDKGTIEEVVNILYDIKNDNPAKFEEHIDNILKNSEVLKTYFKETEPTFKKCTKHFLEVLKFYSHYNAKKKISRIGIYADLYSYTLNMAISFKSINKSFYDKKIIWDEPRIATIDISNDRKIKQCLDGKNFSKSEIEKYLRSIINDSIEELICKIENENYNCNSELVIGFNFEGENFNIERSFKVYNNFQEDLNYVDKEISKIINREKNVAEEVLLSLSLENSPKRIIDDFEKIYYKNPTYPMYYELAKCYDYYKIKNSFQELIEFTLYNTIIGRRIYHNDITLDFIINNMADNKKVIDCLRLEFDSCKLEALGKALERITGEDISIYFRLCPKCKVKLPSKKALQCLGCKFSWHKCPKCNESWERDTSKCKHCGYDLYTN